MHKNRNTPKKTPRFVPSGATKKPKNLAKIWDNPGRARKAPPEFDKRFKDKNKLKNVGGGSRDYKGIMNKVKKKVAK